MGEGDRTERLARPLPVLNAQDPRGLVSYLVLCGFYNPMCLNEVFSTTVSPSAVF